MTNPNSTAVHSRPTSITVQKLHQMNLKVSSALFLFLAVLGGSSLLHARFAVCVGFSCWGAQPLDARAQ